MVLSFMIMLILHLLTPFWWWVMLIPFINSVIRGASALRSFGSGFVSAGLLWTAMALFLNISFTREVVPRVMAMTGATSFWMLVLVTGIVAGLCGGFASLCGFYLRDIFRKQPVPEVS